MKRLAIIDDYEELALKMGNWENLSPEVQTDAFNDHLVGEDAVIKRLLPYVSRPISPRPSKMWQHGWTVNRSGFWSPANNPQSRLAGSP